MHGTDSKTTLAIVLIAFLAFHSSACSGNGSTSSLAKSNQDLELHVWPATWVENSSAKISMEKKATDGGMIVEIRADEAVGVKALYFNLDYDPRRLSPLLAEAVVLEESGGDLLKLAILDEPGTVHFGQVIANYPDHEGFTGSGVMARVEFANHPMKVTRKASAAPASDRSAAQLAWNSADSRLEWGYYSEGDFDQNSETNISDMSPLGLHFKKADSFGADSIEAVVDGDANGEINLADLTSIGANYFAKVTVFNIYFSDDPNDKPKQNSAASTTEAIGSVDYESGAGERGVGRLQFQYPIETAELPKPVPANGYFWIRPADGTSEGTPSTTALADDLNQSPEAALSADPLTGTAPLVVSFDASATIDPEDTILTFSWDWDGQANGIAWVEGGPSPTIDHTYTEAGTYHPMVRAEDAAGLADTASVEIVVELPPNDPRTADLTATPSSGVAPLAVLFDASGSFDSDGTIVQYEFDLNGDGFYEQDNGSDPDFNHIYNAAVSVNAAVRVTDDRSGTNEASVLVVVTGSGPAFYIRPDGFGYPIWGELPTTGDGSEQDPFVIGGAYSPPMEYGLEANTKADFTGTDIDPADLTWSSFPPLIVTWPAPGVCSKSTSGEGYVYATDASLNESNRVYVTVIENYAPKAILNAIVRIGTEPLSVIFDASASFDWDGDISKFEFDLDADGTFELDNGKNPTTSWLYAKGTHNVGLRVTDDLGEIHKFGTSILAEEFPVLLKPDMIYALPSNTVATAGDHVGVTVYTHQAANPFQFMNGCRIVMPLGNYYVRYSFNVGDPGGYASDVDGVWEDMMPGSFLLPPDFLFTETDIGGGLIGIDFNVTPLVGSDLTSATGAMFNFELEVNTNILFTFQRTLGVDRTYYSSGIGGEYFWSDDDNSGFPGISLTP